jgi:hypothetical protein
MLRADRGFIQNVMGAPEEEIHSLINYFLVTISVPKARLF